MTKPVGGRGQKAPYDTVQVRCPVPIKPEVDALIARYREQALDSENNNLKPSDTQEFKTCIKLVFRFIEEHGLTEQLGNKTPRMYRLNQFFEWLELQSK